MIAVITNPETAFDVGWLFGMICGAAITFVCMKVRQKR